MVWSRVLDGTQEEEGMPESIINFNNKKWSGFVGFDMWGSYGSNKGSLRLLRLEKLYSPRLSA